MTQDNLEPIHPQYQAPVEHNLSIPLHLIATILTCGLWGIYWNYRQMLACNDLLGRREFDFWLWLLLTIVTCGIYHFYYQYKMGTAIVEIQHNQGGIIFDNLPVISVIVSVLGLTIVVDCIHQGEINKLVG